jgi:hypothetical protein
MKTTVLLFINVSQDKVNNNGHYIKTTQLEELYKPYKIAGMPPWITWQKDYRL